MVEIPHHGRLIIGQTDYKVSVGLAMADYVPVQSDLD